MEFDDPRDAEDAVYELNGRSLNGDRVVVEHARRPGSGRGDRDRFGGGGGGFRGPPSRGRAPTRSVACCVMMPFQNGISK